MWIAFRTAARATLIAVALCLMGCLGIRDEVSLSAFLDSRMEALGAKSYGAGILRGESLVWTHSWGMADSEAGVPASADTIYRICSISKTMTGVAAMVLVEQGRLDLDADISGYLPVTIRNPWRPGVPITTRMLMSHTSSIVDDWGYLDPLLTIPEPAMPLGDLVKGCLTPEGRPEWKQSFIDADPGTAAVYSNTGVAVLAWVVETVSGMPFQDWTASVVFAPAGATDVGWFESSMPAGLTYARPYGFDGSAIPQYRVPPWPAGSLLCSVRSFAPLAAIFVNRGVVGGNRILLESSLVEMERVVSGHFGLSLEAPAQHPNMPELRGHYGDMPGFHTGFLYDPAAKVGVYYFANGEFDHTLLRAELESALIQAAQAFPL